MHTHLDMLRRYLLEVDGFNSDPVFFDVTLWQPSIFVWSMINGQFKDTINQTMHEYFNASHGIICSFQKQNHFYSIALDSTDLNRDFINMALKEYGLIYDIHQFMLEEMDTENQTLEDNCSLPQSMWVNVTFHL